METTVEFTPVMLVMIAVLSAVLQGFKPLIAATKLKPFMPILSLIVGVGAAYVTKQDNYIVSGIVIGAAASFGYDIFKGLGPKAVPVLLIGILLFSMGCEPVRPVRMHPSIAMQVRMADITTAEFNNRCQAGDCEACKIGLEKSTETISIIRKGLDGEKL